MEDNEEIERIARVKAFYTPEGITSALTTLKYRPGESLAAQSEPIQLVVELFVRFFRASKIAVDNEGDQLADSIRSTMEGVAGLSFAVEREGHATDGLGIAAAVTAPIPFVGLVLSVACSVAAVGTGIAAEVRENQLSGIVQNISGRIRSSCGWSCIDPLASACEAYVSHTTRYRSHASPMEQLWQYVMSVDFSSSPLEVPDLEGLGLSKIQRLFEFSNTSECGILEGICVDGQWSVQGGVISYVGMGGAAMISSLFGLQMVIHGRAIINLAIQGTLWSTMGQVGLFGQMSRSQRFALYLHNSTSNATHGLGRASLCLGALVIILAGFNIDARVKKHQKLRADLRDVEDKYIVYYRELCAQAIALRDF